MNPITRIACLITLLACPFPVFAQQTVQATSISASGARSLLARAAQLATQRNLRMCIALTDATGQLIAFEKMDGSIPGCVESSIAKARSSAQFRVPTAAFFERAAKENLPLGFVPGILPAAGGAPLKQGEMVIGAVGVSGGNVQTERALAADIAALML